jgi:hypothetical protein
MRAGDAESKHNDDRGGQYPAHDNEGAGECAASSLTIEASNAQSFAHF